MKITEIPAKPKEKKKVRVAAYARVSSDKDAAFHSLEAQKDYYEQYPEVESAYEGRKYGFNIKSQLLKLFVIFPAVSALVAWICTLLY